MSDIESRNDADNCFVCGSENPIGLNIDFKFVDEQCVGEFTPGENHVGFDGVTHGGIIFSVLEGVMANWLFLQQARWFTGKCEIRYREPLPVGETITVACELKRRKGRLVQLSSTATNTQSTVVAEADASFMIDDFGNMPDV